MKKFLISIICATCVGAAFAAGENVATSKAFVDTAVALKQDKIPANSGATQVLTNTGESGTVGTKGIYNTSGEYFEQSDSLIDAVAMNAAVQNAINTEFRCVSWVDDDPTKDCLLVDIGVPTQYDQYEIFGPDRTVNMFGDNYNTQMTFDSNSHIATLRRGNNAARLEANASFHLSTGTYNHYVDGHKYYLWAKMRTTAPDMVVQIWRNTTGYAQIYATNEWGIRGTIFQASFPNDGGYHYPVLSYACTYCSVDNHEGIMIDQNEMGLYDLTAIFGAGNEPATPAAAARALNLLYVP